MKIPKYILFIWLFIINALAVNVNAITLPGMGKAKTRGQAAAEQKFQKTIKRVFGINSSPAEKIKEIETSVNNVKDPHTVERFILGLGEQQHLCSDYTERASNCCKDVVACGSSKNSGFGQMAGEVLGSAPMLLEMFGGDSGGGLASCLSALPGLIGAMSVQEGESALCKKYGEGSGDELGCSDYCGDLAKAAQAVLKEMTKIRTRMNASNSKIKYTKYAKHKKEIIGIKKELLEEQQLCENDTEKGAQEANLAKTEMLASAASALQCAESFEDEDGGGDQEGLEEDPDVVAQSDMAKGSLGDFGSGLGTLSKARGDSFGGGFPDGDEPESPGIDSPQKTTDGNGRAPTNSPGGGGFGGGFGGGSGGGGVSAQKANNGKSKGVKPSKKSNLFFGYKKARGGAGFSGKRGNKRLWLALAKKKRKEKEKDKKKSRDLAKFLAAAGVSPNSQGNIFARNTKRFIAASIKEKLFDARTNRKLWMK